MRLTGPNLYLRNDLGANKKIYLLFATLQFYCLLFSHIWFRSVATDHNRQWPATEKVWFGGLSLLNTPFRQDSLKLFKDNMFESKDLIIRSHILYVFYCAGITCLAAFIHPPLLHPRLHFSRARCSSAHVMACTTVSSLSEFEWHGPVISHWHSRIGQRLKSNLGRRVYIRANSANGNRNSSTFSATVRVGTLRASLGVEVCTVDWISRASRTSLYGVHYYRPTLTKSPTPC